MCRIPDCDVGGRSRRPCARRSDGRYPVRQGFTLIELLIVVAIIALLVSILLPALALAQQLTRTAVCAANLHHMGLGVEMYKSEWGLTEPWLFTNGTGDNPNEPWNFDTYPHLPGNPANALYEKGKYVETPEMFFCPHYDRNYKNDYSPLAETTPGNALAIWGTYSYWWKHIPNNYPDPQVGPVDPRDCVPGEAQRNGAGKNWPAPPNTHMNNNCIEVGPKSTEMVMSDTLARWNWWFFKVSYAHYNVLFVDDHVELVANDDLDFDVFVWGPVGWRHW